MQRGFTLLEVIVAVSLVLALGALVMPAVSRRIAGATGESVSRGLRAAVGEARGDAVRESRSLRVEVVTNPVSGDVRVVAREFATVEDGAAPARFVGPIFDVGEATAGGEDEATERVLMELPRWTRVSREAPVVEGEWGDSGEGGADAGFGDEEGAAESEVEEGGETVCLGVLLPTGGAVAGAPAYLTLPGSWTVVVTLDAWTGDAVVTRWEPPAPEDEWGSEEEGEMSER